MTEKNKQSNVLYLTIPFENRDLRYGNKRMFPNHEYRPGGLGVERPPRVREVVGSIPGRVIPKTLKNGSSGFPFLALRLMGLALRRVCRSP